MSQKGFQCIDLNIYISLDLGTTVTSCTPEEMLSSPVSRLIRFD